MGDFYAEGKLVAKDTTKALSLYEAACQIKDIKACYKAGMLIVDGKVETANFYQALRNLETACKADYEKACEASRPIMFQARFEGIIQNAFDSKLCQVWTINEAKSDRNRTVVSVKGDQFEVLAGKYKGQTFTAVSKGTKYKKDDKKKIAQSFWDLVSGNQKIKIEHHENWNFIRYPDPTSSFPGPESFSRDKYGEKSVYYSREKEYLARNVYKHCTFIDKVKMLGSEHCSEVQALIASQLVSKCKKK